MSQTFYIITLSSIEISGIKLFGVTDKLAIVDSGTTTIMLANALYTVSFCLSVYYSHLKKFTNTLLARYCSSSVKLVGLCTSSNIFDPDICWYLTDEEVNEYPTITLNFPSYDDEDTEVSLVLNASSYFIKTKVNS